MENTFAIILPRGIIEHENPQIRGEFKFCTAQQPDINLQEQHPGLAESKGLAEIGKSGQIFACIVDYKLGLYSPNQYWEKS